MCNCYSVKYKCHVVANLIFTRVTDSTSHGSFANVHNIKRSRYFILNLQKIKSQFFCMIFLNIMQDDDASVLCSRVEFYELQQVLCDCMQLYEIIVIVILCCIALMSSLCYPNGGLVVFLWQKESHFTNRTLSTQDVPGYCSLLLWNVVILDVFKTMIICVYCTKNYNVNILQQVLHVTVLYLQYRVTECHVYQQDQLDRTYSKNPTPLADRGPDLNCFFSCLPLISKLAFSYEDQESIQNVNIRDVIYILCMLY